MRGGIFCRIQKTCCQRGGHPGLCNPCVGFIVAHCNAAGQNIFWWRGLSPLSWCWSTWWSSCHLTLLCSGLYGGMDDEWPPLAQVSGHTRDRWNHSSRLITESQCPVSTVSDLPHHIDIIEQSEHFIVAHASLVTSNIMDTHMVTRLRSNEAGCWSFVSPMSATHVSSSLLSSLASLGSSQIQK